MKRHPSAAARCAKGPNHLLVSMPPSSTLATYRLGFAVNRHRGLSRSSSSASSPRARTASPPFTRARTFSSRAFSAKTLRSPAFASLSAFPRARSMVSRSARQSSALTVSMSATGSTLPLTWTMLSSSKQRATWAMAWASRMWPRKRLPNPSPWDAPRTRPATSTNSTWAGRASRAWASLATAAKRGSGTGTTPTLGSMVQKG